MDEQTKGIVGAIVHVARRSGSLVTLDPRATGRAVLEACAAWEATERAQVISRLKDTPPWAAYELKTLQLGRAIDFVIRKRGCWKGRGPLLDAVAEVARTARFGRGRQSFVTTLGAHGEGAYGAELAALLPDETMTGYAVRALHESASGEYLDEVLAAAAHGRPWVRNAARAYAESMQSIQAKVRSESASARSPRTPARVR